MPFQLFATPTMRPKPSREASSSVSDATRSSSFFASLRASAARRASPARRSCESASATWSATCWASGTSLSLYVPGVRERKRRPPANCHWPSKKIGTLRSERMPSAARCRHLSVSTGTSFSTSRTISVDQSFTRAWSSREIRIGARIPSNPPPETAYTLTAERSSFRRPIAMRSCGTTGLTISEIASKTSRTSSARARTGESAWSAS